MADVKQYIPTVKIVLTTTITLIVIFGLASLLGVTGWILNPVEKAKAQFGPKGA